MTTRTKRSIILSMTAIISLVILELYALSKGVNGKLFSGVILIIGGIGGFSIAQIKNFFIK